jgi:uncharacterized protein YaaN involved in tellurite resistance
MSDPSASQANTFTDRLTRIEGQIALVLSELRSGMTGLKADISYLDRTTTSNLQAERDLRIAGDHALSEAVQRLETEGIKRIETAKANRSDLKDLDDRMTRMANSMKYAFTTLIALLAIGASLLAAYLR